MERCAYPHEIPFLTAEVRLEFRPSSPTDSRGNQQPFLFTCRAVLALLLIDRRCGLDAQLIRGIADLPTWFTRAARIGAAIPDAGGRMLHGCGFRKENIVTWPLHLWIA